MPEHPVSGPWRAAIDAVAGRRGSVVLVVDGTDVGKSAFCRHVIAAARTAMDRVALVDADPRQKQVGPPAAVTLAFLPAMFTAGIAFVGGTSPARRFARL